MAAPYKTNGNKLRGGYSLYTKRKHPTTCSAEPQELVVDGTEIDLRLDSQFQDEELVKRNFSNCIGISNPKRACRLVEIYLLHALHKEDPSRSFDVFLVLNRLPPENSKPNRYRCIGLIKTTNKHVVGKSWSQIMQAKMEPRREDFWLF